MFEKQVVDSMPSRNPNAPSWKDNFVLYEFNLAFLTIDSSVHKDWSKLRILVMQEDLMIAKAKIWANFAGDERQHVEEAPLNEDETYTGMNFEEFTYNLQGSLTVSWRYEPNEEVKVNDPREVIGTFQITS